MSAEIAAIATQQERYNLARFELADMIRCGRRLRDLRDRDLCMEDAAQRVVDFLRDSLLVGEGPDNCCALVRCFKTHPMSQLPAGLADIAKASLKGLQPSRSDVPCLTLLGSSGDLPEWNGRHGSEGHRAIPLESVEVVQRAPMIAQLIHQMGLSPQDVLHPTEDFLLDAEQRSFNVFYVPEARGSHYVPAQDFVSRHGIRSVLGFGGLLPSGDLFAVVLFSRLPITRDVADMFRTVALSTKLVLLPFSRGPVFREDLDRIPDAGESAQERQRAEIATLQLLIPALEDVALQQTAKLHLALREAESRTREVSELNSALEQRVEERTAALVTLNEELKAFSYSVSHDLRAPLRAIDGFSAALEEDFSAVLDETGIGYLRRIRTGVQRMGQLIDAMLRLSRVTRVDLARTRIDLSAVAHSVAQELAEREPRRTVHFDIDPGLSVHGDPQLMRALLENLLGNAFKFTGRAPSAQIRFGWSDTERAFFVQDNGAGFDMRDADKLFRPFTRLHPAREFDGTGVGLATVARIVSRHGGSLWAQSAVDQGATFFFRLQ